MAEQSQDHPQEQQDRGNSTGGGIVQAIARGSAAFYETIVCDHSIVGAFSRGASEFSQALKAFPDSIHVDHSGVLSHSPDHGGQSGDVHGPPSDLVRDGVGGVQGQEQTHSPAAPSPSDIVRGHADTVHSQQGSNGQAYPSPSDTARDKGDGQVLTQQKPDGMGWADWIEQQRKGNQDGNAGEDQNERGKGRSLPDEQREKEKGDQDRGRGR